MHTADIDGDDNGDADDSSLWDDDELGDSMASGKDGGAASLGGILRTSAAAPRRVNLWGIDRAMAEARDHDVTAMSSSGGSIPSSQGYGRTQSRAPARREK